MEEATPKKTPSVEMGVLVEEDADEEAEGDDAAGAKDFECRARVEGDEGDGDGEWEHEAMLDLVEGGVDIFEGVVAEAVG